MNKRVLSLLLVLTMCLSLFPASVFAVEETENTVPKINGIQVLDKSGQTNDGEKAENAFDGNTNTKWCDNTTGDKGWLAFTLPEVYKVTSMKVYHASSASSSSDPQACNTKRFALETLKDPAAYEKAENQHDYLATDANWKTVVEVDNSAQTDITDTAIEEAPRASIYRLNVTDGDGRAEWSAVRIYEIELYGRSGFLNPVTVTFDPGVPAEGVPVVNTMDAVTMEKGEEYELPDCIYRADGYGFAGWLVGADPEAKQPHTMITVTDSVTVTAKWAEAVSATIEPGTAGDTQVQGTMTAEPVGKGSTYRLPACTYEAEGWSFSGWTVVNGDQEPQTLQPGDTVTVAGAITLTANWVKSAILTFAPGKTGETVPDGTIPAKAVLPGTTVTLPDNKFTAEGYDFIGWSVVIGDAAPVLMQPQESVKLTASGTATAQWVERHVHGRIRYTAIKADTGLNITNDWDHRWFYFPMDMTLPVQTKVLEQTCYLCLNGKNITGTVLSGHTQSGTRELIIEDCKGTGVLTGVNAPALDFGAGAVPKEAYGEVAGGTLKRTGTDGPVINMISEDKWKQAGLKMTGGALVQTTNAPIIRCDSYYDYIRLSGGTLTTTGQPAIEILPNTISSGGYHNSKVYLSGSPVFNVGDGTAHIKVSAPGQIAANSGGNWPEPYTGDVVLIDCSALNVGEVVVMDVTDENWTLFAPADPTKKLERSGNNLVLVESTAAQHTLKLDVNGGKPAIPVERQYEGYQFLLPDKDSITRKGYSLMGWEDEEGNIYKCRMQMTMPGKDLNLKAKWAKNPEQDADGFYRIGTQEQLKEFYYLVNSGYYNLNVRLTADLTVDDTFPTFGYYNDRYEYYTGEFDGGGHTLTVNRNITEQHRGGVFDYVSGIVVRNLTVEGTIHTSAPMTGGIIGYATSQNEFYHCVSKVNIITSHPGVNGSGGFIGYTDENGDGRFRDCIFAGSIRAAEGVNAHSCAGIVGTADGYAPKMKGVLSVGALEMRTGEGESDNSAPCYRPEGQSYQGDTYFLEDAITVNGEANKSFSWDQGLSRTAEFMASGSVCHELNASNKNNPDAIWRQNLTAPNKDAFPTLDPTHAPVFQTEAGGYTNTNNMHKVTVRIIGGRWRNSSSESEVEKVSFVEHGKQLTQDNYPVDPRPNAGYEGSGQWDVDPATATITEDTVFTCTFTKVNDKFITITFLPGEGGEGEMEAVEWLKGRSFKLRPCTFTHKDNNTFRCWSVKIGNGEPNEFYETGDITNPSENVTVTALWEHKHDIPLKFNAYFQPAATKEELSAGVSNVSSYYYATADMDLGTALEPQSSTLHFCTNGRQMTGSFSVKNGGIELYDFHGGATLTGAGGPVLGFSSSGYRDIFVNHLTVKQPASVSEPVAEMSFDYNKLTLRSGTLLQEAACPAIRVKSSSNIVTLQDGLVKTTGQPAVEFTAEAGAESVVRLGEEILLDVGAEAPHIKVSHPGQISASYLEQKHDGNPDVWHSYQGQVLRIDCDALALGDIVVKDVEKKQADRFVAYGTKYQLFYDGVNIITIDAKAGFGTITFDIGEARGKQPEPIQVAAGLPVYLPVSRDLRLDGKFVVGWTDGTKNYAPGERYTFPEGTSARFTPLWGAKEHKHDDKTWRPLYNGSILLTEPEQRYFYAGADSDIGYLEVREQPIDLCLNGKTVTGKISVPMDDYRSEPTVYGLVIRDPHGGGKLTNDDNVARFRDDTQSTIILESGGLERTGNNGPVIGNFGQYSKFIMNGGLIDQQTHSPAIETGNGTSSEVILNGGTIRASGDFAIELTLCEYYAYINKLYLTGAPVFELPQNSKAEIKIARDEQIHASKDGVPYTGQKLRIYIDPFNREIEIGDTIVKDVIGDGWKKFEVAGNSYSLALKDNNLVLIRKAQLGVLSFDIGSATGTKPFDLPGYKDYPVALPKGEDLRSGGKILVGWTDGVNKFTPGEKYIPTGADVTFTPVWGETHEHDGKVWLPVYSGNSMSNDKDFYYYLNEDNIDLTGKPSRYYGGILHLCLNGKTATGKIEGYVEISDSHGGGKVTNTNDDLLHAGSSAPVLKGGTLERLPGTEAGTVISASNFVLDGATIDQKCDFPAVQRYEGTGAEIHVKSGTVRTTGQPAFAFIGARYEELLYLSGTPTFDIGEGKVHIKLCNKARIIAEDGGVPYTGDVLTIDCTDVDYESIVVSDVTASNKDKFVPTDVNQIFEYDETAGTLKLMPKDYKRTTVTFEIGSGASGTTPAAHNGFTEIPFTLPQSTGLSKPGCIFLGWNDGNKTYLAGKPYTPTQETHTLTAQWLKLPEQISGVYQLKTQEDLESFIQYANLMDASANAKLLANLTMDNEYPRLGSKDKPYTGNFDGGGFTITVNATFLDDYHGGVFDYVGNNVYIHDLVVDGSITATGSYIGGIIGILDDKGDGSGTIERCVSDVEILANDSLGENHCVAGIFGQSDIRNFTIKDCAFTGKIEALYKTSLCGGIGGYSYNYCNLTMNGVLMAGELKGISSAQDKGQSEIMLSSSNCNDNNCYYVPIEGMISERIGTKITRENVASGQIARWMNGDKANGEGVWRQNLSTGAKDPAPLPLQSHGKVLRVSLTVSNGTWGDGSKTDKDVYVNPNAVLEAPTGMNPSTDYGFGAWLKSRKTGKAITEPITQDDSFTYLYEPAATITFKVVNGTWSDKKTDPIVLTVPRGVGKYLTKEQIPTEMLPNDGYGMGSWDADPTQQIDESKTFTYSFAKVQTVTFKVANGTWQNGKTEDITLTVKKDSSIGEYGDIPTGARPNQGFGYGEWQPEAPTSSTKIEQDAVYTYQFKKALTITFRIVNGKWTNGSSADQKVSLADGTALSEGTIPTGMTADLNCGLGAWDTEPNSTTILHENKVYTYTYKELAKAQFKVENGTWKDSTVKPIEVQIEGGTALTKEQIPTDMKPNAHYEGGAWKPVPNTTTILEGKKSYTYIYTFTKIRTTTVKFTIENGTWDGFNNQEKTVSMELPGGKGHLAKNQIPTGMTAADGYENGHWVQKTAQGEKAVDLTDKLDITGETEFIYRFDPIKKATITFKVENGTFKGGIKETTVEVMMPGGKGTLPESKIPTGMKAADGYESGKWNTKINTAENGVIGDVTYTYTFTEIPEATVTFKVENGTFGGSETSMTVKVRMPAVQNKTGYLTEEQIPANMKPNKGYGMGNWKVEPKTETAIKGDVTFTYVYKKIETVTLKVENGTWSDETTTEKKIVVENGTTLTGEQIPKSMLPSTDYEGGQWIPDLTTETKITESKTYTYTFKPVGTAMVTFEVVGGKFEDGKTIKNVSVKIPGGKGKLPESEIPTPTVSDGYEGGSWNTEINTAENGVTGDVTYTYTYTKIPEATVTFKVENGKFGGSETTKIVKVRMPAAQNNTGYLTKDQIPTDMQPNKGYGMGAWDTEPKTETEIKGDVTYTYSYKKVENVTFKIVNGTWDGKDAAEQTLEIKRGTCLTTDQIPTGMKPNKGYQNGTWDVEPNAETPITGDVTYTYTYVENWAKDIKSTDKGITLTFTNNFGKVSVMVAEYDEHGKILSVGVKEVNAVKDEICEIALSRESGSDKTKLFILGDKYIPLRTELEIKAK